MISWTIYDHPKDFPLTYVARKFDLKGGKDTPTMEHITNDDLAKLREAVKIRVAQENGGWPLRFARHPNDDPVIMETWM